MRERKWSNLSNRPRKMKIKYLDGTFLSIFEGVGFFQALLGVLALKFCLLDYVYIEG